MATTQKAKKTKTKKAVEDVLIEKSSTIENLSKDDTYARVRAMDETVEESYFELGGVLNRINAEQWYVEDGHERFTDFVEAEFGIRRSKALSLIKIYNDLVAAEVAYDVIGHLGWSKLRALSGVLTKKNAKGWAKKAAEMTKMELEEYIKQQAQDDDATSGDLPGDDDVPQVSQMTFKVHAAQKEIIDEALTGAKKETGSEFATVALEAICLGYLAGPPKPKNEEGDVEYDVAYLKSIMANYEWLPVLQTFCDVWPDVDVEVKKTPEVDDAA